MDVALVDPIPEVDFVQDVKPAGDGALVTRWSGLVHRIGRDGRVRTLRLPKPEPGGLFYTAVASGGRVCATFCADVTVVCADL